jgi:hypothetical protein
MAVEQTRDFRCIRSDTCAEPSWCKTTAFEGGVWNTFAMVKSKLCSGEGGFDKPWGPIDVNAVTCPCGEVPAFPDNACIPDATEPECGA